MKSLKTVQTASKVLCIFEFISFICTIIGAAGALVGGISLLCMPYLGKDIVDMIISEAGMENTTQLGIALIAECIYMAGIAVAMGFTHEYFKHELEDGTPFTYSGAKKLFRTGIINIAVPLGAFIVSSMISVFVNTNESALSNELSITSGIAMILFSFVFKYGADVLNKSDENQ